ncbi:MAG: hypothetical protein ACI9RO_001800, partial [Alteromonas macleodii]
MIGLPEPNRLLTPEYDTNRFRKCLREKRICHCSPGSITPK